MRSARFRSPIIVWGISLQPALSVYLVYGNMSGELRVRNCICYSDNIGYHILDFWTERGIDRGTGTGTRNWYAKPEIEDVKIQF